MCALVLLLFLPLIQLEGFSAIPQKEGKKKGGGWEVDEVR